MWIKKSDFREKKSIRYALQKKKEKCILVIISDSLVLMGGIILIQVNITSNTAGRWHVVLVHVHVAVHYKVWCCIKRVLVKTFLLRCKSPTCTLKSLKMAIYTKWNPFLSGRDRRWHPVNAIVRGGYFFLYLRVHLDGNWL